ncbi:MAG: hypothetical protein LBQ66_15090 [Planctomycetaceae bacterium]|jgi:hypothetical protein|nr:hypothetical protein [Planctomycetaceae bacterium]
MIVGGFVLLLHKILPRSGEGLERGRDARVPVRAASRKLSAAPTGRFDISTRFTILWDEGKPRPYNADATYVANVFWRSALISYILINSTT